LRIEGKNRMDKPHPARIFFSPAHPLSAHVPMRFADCSERTLTVEVRAPEAFRADGGTPQLHSGFATIVLDTVMGGSVFGSIEKLQPIATVGLNVQHRRRPLAGEELVCQADVVGVHDEIAHVRGTLATAQGETLAIAVGTFMIGTRSTPIGSKP
jgi:acyl-coenzyme A thioesterase PaaI-like protein